MPTKRVVQVALPQVKDLERRVLGRGEQVVAAWVERYRVQCAGVREVVLQKTSERNHREAKRGGNPHQCECDQHLCRR